MTVPQFDDADYKCEADKLLDLEEGDVVAYEAYDGDLIKHDDRTKRTYRKRVTGVSRLSEDSKRVTIHVEDIETGEKTTLSPHTRMSRRKWGPVRTGDIKETVGPHATHPDAWTRTVNDLRKVE